MYTGTTPITETEEVISLREFTKQFNFQSINEGVISTELEYLVSDREGRKPRAAALEILIRLANQKDIGPELSNYQLEVRSFCPVPIEKLYTDLSSIIEKFNIMEQLSERKFIRTGVGAEDLPISVYPLQRYIRIKEELMEANQDGLQTAMGLIATQFNIGVSCKEQAIAVHNGLLEHAEELWGLADTSNGERRRRLEKHLLNGKSRPFENWEDFYQEALEYNFAEDLCRCWRYIRITQHGSVEIRTLDAMGDIDQLVTVGQRCHKLATGFM